MESPSAQAAQKARSKPFATDRWALLGSLSLHALLFVLLGWSPRPETNAPFQLPVEMEIGLGESDDKELGGNAPVEGRRSDVANEQGHAEETKVAKPKAATPKPSTPAPVAEAVDPSAANTSAIVDAGVAATSATDSADASTTQLAGSGTADAGPVGPRRGVGGGSGSGFGTQGALLALRIDVPNVRKSALILETEALLALVPGWQRMFAGSGLQPLQHFRRFVVASPNLHPARLAMAAQVRGAVRGVEALKQRAAQKAPLRDEDGVTLGTWSARGNTVRDIAFINDSTFAISRAQDITRLLALGRVLGAQVTAETRDPDPLIAGLFHMGATEALSLSVHHVAVFVPKPTSPLPQSLRFVLDEPTQYAVQLHVTGDYENDEQAERALSHWRKTYEEVAQGPEVALIGLAGAVEHAAFERQDNVVHARTQLTMAQLRYLLGRLRELLQGLVPASAE